MRSSKRYQDGARLERIRASPRFNGQTFANTRPVGAGLKEGVDRPTMRDFLCGGERRVPSGPLPLEDPTSVWRSAPESGLRVTWFGHSTLVIEIDGARFLTDPVWGNRASPLSFAGPRRFHPPAAPLAALPPLDAVILSHDHYDHLDRSTIRALGASTVPFVCSLGVGAHLERWGIDSHRITELDWWESTTVKGIDLTAGPAQHFSGRGIKDRNATLWSSIHVRGPSHSIFYGADSGLTAEYTEVSRRLGPFDLVAIEIGAHHPAWGDIHMGPDNALAAYAMLGSGLFLPIHWGTFNLAMHPWDEPAERIWQLAPAAGVPLVMPRIGAAIEPERGPESEPWWRAVRTNGPPVVPAREAPSVTAHVNWAPD